MRTNQEIKELIASFQARPVTPSVDAIINVLENDLTEDRIEMLYYDPNDPWVEQAALKAREWLNGEIESEDVYC
jgi:hypothetical protein